MADKLLDLEGLTYYDQKIKDYIDTADEKVTSDLTDKLTEETQARTQADTALGNRIDDIEEGTTSVGKLKNPLQFGVEGSLDNYDGSIAGKKITKAVLGLGNVDNTADINKPVSTAQQSAIDDAKSELLGDAGTNYNTLGKLEDAIQAEVTRAGQAEDDIDADLQEFKTATNQNITQIEQDLATEGERITALDNNVVKKTGQSSQAIQGNIQIQGDLTVNGTTTSEDHQTLMVQDNIIVTNSDGVAISGLSGIAIRINSTSAFGIVYDPSVQELKAGLGTLSEQNEFTFSSGEGYPITLRDSDGDLVDGNIVQWDNVGKRLTDSGIVANLIALQNGTYEGMTVGNATNAVNATNDGSGQNIASTYATKAENNAKYTKPDGGIPKGDLASAVQTSLSKADTALQSIPAATPSRLGGVKPASKTTEMTEPVGVDGFGELWVQPTGIEKNEIISVESLPDATIDSPDFVQTLDGKLYRKKVAADNSVLAGTWAFDDTINYEGQIDVNFSSNGKQFIGFKGSTETGIGSGDQYYNLFTFEYLRSGTYSVSAYMYGTNSSDSNFSGWSSGEGEEYRIVTFAEGTVNSEALGFMQSNAVKQSVYSYEQVGAGAAVEFATVDECAEAFNSSAVKLISFNTLYHSSLQAEEGMTWREWINSSYSDPAFSESTDRIWEAEFVGSAKQGRVLSQEYTDVYPTDKIIANYSYRNSSSGGGAVSP